MIRIREIKIPLNEMGEDVLKKRVAHLLKIDSAEIKALEIKKEAIDARKEIFYVYEVVVSLINENKILKYNHNKNVFKDETTPYQVLKKENISPKQIIIVGTGPAGLFTAYSLVLQGYKPTIIERGSKIENRVKEVENFWETGNLNTECNVQFGEGGAGTFSDGKLNTLIKDSRGFIEFV